MQAAIADVERKNVDMKDRDKKGNKSYLKRNSKYVGITLLASNKCLHFTDVQNPLVGQEEEEGKVKN